MAIITRNDVREIFPDSVDDFETTLWFDIEDENGSDLSSASNLRVAFTKNRDTAPEEDDWIDANGDDIINAPSMGNLEVGFKLGSGHHDVPLGFPIYQCWMVFTIVDETDPFRCGMLKVTR